MVVKDTESGKDHSVIPALPVINIFTAEFSGQNLRSEILRMTPGDSAVNGISPLSHPAVFESTAAGKNIDADTDIRVEKLLSYPVGILLAVVENITVFRFPFNIFLSQKMTEFCMKTIVDIPGDI